MSYKKMDYRNSAKEAIERAKQELSAENDDRLRYAALELRMALECLIYEKAENYTEELSTEKLSTWQPRQLLGHILEIDPYADKTATISAGLEEEHGEPAKDMKAIGTDRVLSLKEIKKYYDRLGSYLHASTRDQVAEKKGATPEKIRFRCNELIKIVDEVLSSSVFNVDIKFTSSIDCQKCGKKIIRRVPPKFEQLLASCINCDAAYTLFFDVENRISWIPKTREVCCGNSECKSPTNLFECELKLGTRWKCQACKGINTIVHGIVYCKEIPEVQREG